MKLLSRLRLQFTHLNQHKFRHGFNDTINLMCPCGTDVETTEHFLLRCHCFSTQRSELFDYHFRLDPSLSKSNTKEKVSYLLCDSRSNSSSLNKEVIKLAIKFLNQLVVLISHCFFEDFAYILRVLFFQNSSEWLLSLSY